VRANLSRDLGFSHSDRLEHARRMDWISDRVVETGGTVIAVQSMGSLSDGEARTSHFRVVSKNKNLSLV